MMDIYNIADMDIENMTLEQKKGIVRCYVRKSKENGMEAAISHLKRGRERNIQI